MHLEAHHVLARHDEGVRAGEQHGRHLAGEYVLRLDVQLRPLGLVAR